MELENAVAEGFEAAYIEDIYEHLEAKLFRGDL